MKAWCRLQAALQTAVVYPVAAAGSGAYLSHHYPNAARVQFHGSTGVLLSGVVPVVPASGLPFRLRFRDLHLA